MAAKIRRQNPPQSDDGPPPAWAASMIAEGELGPWKKTDRPEFWHASAEAQQWFLRLDTEELDLVRGAAKLVSSVRRAARWGKRIFWAFTTGLGAALAAGKNLQELPGVISDVISMIRGLF